MVDWDDEACVRWLPYTHLNAELLSIPALEVASV